MSRKRTPTNPVERPKRVHSEATKEKQRQKALEQGERRMAAIEGRISAAQIKIEGERAAKLARLSETDSAVEVPPELQFEEMSRAEFLRIANVNESTLLNNDKYADFLKALDKWLAAINFKPKAQEQAEVLTNGSRGRSQKERLAAWIDLYGRLAQSHRDTELELQNTKAVLQKSTKEVAALTSEVRKLSEALHSASGKVVSLPARG